jgi:hypothetical protein
LFSAIAYAEDASGGITTFSQDWAVNFIINYNMGIFGRFDSPDEYRTDKPFNVGLGIRYKTISAQASTALSFTQPLANPLFNSMSYDFEIDSYFDKVYYRAYFKRYSNLYEYNSSETQTLDIHSSGVMAAFVHNNENHSLSSVIKLDKRQNTSSGSLLYGFGIFHSSIHSLGHSPAETISKYNDRQHFLYFGPSVGYSYTWLFNNGIFLNLAFVHFSTLAININSGKPLYIPKVEPLIVVGHHNNTWSVNLKLMDYSAFIIWGKNDYDILTLASMTILFSKRF